MARELTGLSDEAVLTRQEEFGLNVLGDESDGPKPWKLLIRQFNNPLLWLLALASIVAWFLLEKHLDAVVIGLAILVNVGLGFLQEFKSERTLAALRNLVQPQAWVLRSGKRQKILARDVVPEDLLLLSAGDKVAADGIILESESLEINEAPLTGESLGIGKSVRAKAFAGTTVIRGRGVLKVTAIGRTTKMGQIAQLVSDTHAELTPLELRLVRLTHQISLILGSLAVLIFIGAVLQGKDLETATVTTIALAVAVIPEGLPIMVTLMLAVGMERLAKAQASVRRLAAVETLGSVTVAALDKTGTITSGELSVTEVIAADPEALLRAAILASDIGVTTLATPDPLETAIERYAKDLGIDHQHVLKVWSRTTVLPFDVRRRLMAVASKRNEKRYLAVKGAPEIILEMCAVSKAAKMEIEEKIRNLSRRGMRVLAVADGEAVDIATLKEPSHRSRLTWLGLLAFSDPLRPDAMSAIADLQKLGIRPLIITGDHPTTARTIANLLNLPTKANEVLTGTELRSLSKTALKQRLRRTHVCARVLPEEKLLLVEALQEMGEVVAMTGDGVNDGPALKRADIGIAMGASGTEVAKETADLVLLDDRLETIVAAVRGGRMILRNLQKGIMYLLGTNIAELLLVVGATTFGLPLPITATQILWINLVTDTLPVAGLAFEVAANPMRRPSHETTNLISPFMWRRIFVMGGVISVACLTVLVVQHTHLVSLARLQTSVFTALAVIQLVNVYTLRTFSHATPPWQAVNYWLLVAIIGGFGLQALAIYGLQLPLNTVALHPQDWALIGIMATLSIGAIEFHKSLERRLGFYHGY